MAQESAPDSPPSESSGRVPMTDCIAGHTGNAGGDSRGDRIVPTDCTQCGHMPKLEDVHVILPEFTGNEILYHVICYSCGHEWVE